MSALHINILLFLLRMKITVMNHCKIYGVLEYENLLNSLKTVCHIFFLTSSNFDTKSNMGPSLHIYTKLFLCFCHKYYTTLSLAIHKFNIRQESKNKLDSRQQNLCPLPVQYDIKMCTHYDQYTNKKKKRIDYREN